MRHIRRRKYVRVLGQRLSCSAALDHGRYNRKPDSRKKIVTPMSMRANRCPHAVMTTIPLKYATWVVTTASTAIAR